MKLNFSFLKAAFFAAFLSFQMFSSPAFSQSKAIANKSETYKDIIEKAYNLSLQKDRQQALNILIAALQKENRPQPVADLRKAINDVAHVFISDKAQQMFEAGISLRKTDLTQALGKLNEASRLEPDNTAILSELSRTMIAKGDCSGAQDLMSKQAKLLPYDEELKLTAAQAYVCQSAWVEYGKIYDSNEVRKSPFQKFWLILEVDRYFKTKNYTKAQEIAANLKKIDGKYPEVSYWSWKLVQVAKKPGLEDAQKYVITCKNISANQYRQYMIDPMLCRHVVEVEADLKGSNGIAE
ncbi:tetratricopeptide repeat protein [Bdellovibrio svalbardensis]|uniref:Tetratricopeptide repeat protein n=1 Tax=Bdellovibrio svalbardensis TaxID=2972972 RepID=A0ABT6DF19_9BACT|nr:hypothetical protein [Bdellovibrio svalbardensis]MDG0814880.1 hypothetical protein [Bdellovibrio svalbardensis]